jgi:peptidoglycan-associated lipoprotein
MNLTFAGVIATLGCGVVLAGGCAKNQAMVKDTPLAPVAAAAPNPTAHKASPEAKPEAKEAALAPATPQPAAAPLATNPPLNAIQPGELKAELQKIYFSFDSASLSDQARTTLAKNAELLKKLDKAKIRIEGNCDERGSDDYNLALGEKRAKEAIRYLVSLGVPAERLSAVSYGKEKPSATGHDEQSWALNRRDEFLVIP